MVLHLRYYELSTECYHELEGITKRPHFESVKGLVTVWFSLERLDLEYITHCLNYLLEPLKRAWGVLGSSSSIEYKPSNLEPAST